MNEKGPESVYDKWNILSFNIRWDYIFPSGQIFFTRNKTFIISFLDMKKSDIHLLFNVTSIFVQNLQSQVIYFLHLTCQFTLGFFQKHSPPFLYGHSQFVCVLYIKGKTVKPKYFAYYNGQLLNFRIPMFLNHSQFLFKWRND